MDMEEAPGSKFADLDRGILDVNGNFETIEQRKVLCAIAIHVGDLLIPGDFPSDTFPRGCGGGFGVDRYGGNKSTYLGMKNWKSA